jgi:hypothetical protein
MYKISCESFAIEGVYGSRVIGAEIGEFRILSKKYLLTLNISKNFFILIDLKKKIKCCSLNLSGDEISDVGEN